ncbi:MAG: hypothetical protein HKL98_11810 [Burkholderiales bacterium]|nr:hypothetical protein [Burkholderiales bacterium]
MQMKANTDVGPNYMQSIQRKVLLNGEEYIPEKNENVSKENNEATEDEFVRYYENKKEVLDHIDNKEPGNYGLIKPRALWYRIPYLNKKFFVFGESHAAVKGSQIKTESHITKPILDEKLSGWQAEDMINNQLVDELDAGLDENSSKLLRALEMWSVHVRSKPTVGGTGAIDLPKISKGETSTREKENGTYRLVVYGEDGSEEYWKPSGSNEVPQNTYDPQTQMLDAIESLFSKVFSEEIKNSFDKFPNGVIVGKAWGHFKDKSWVGHEKETLIKQNVSRFLYDAAKFKVSSEYGKLGEIGDIKTKDEKWNADNYRDEFMFLRILKAKDGGFSFASIGNAHLVRLKDRFNEKNIPCISMEDFYGSYAVDAVDTKKIAHKNSPVFRKNQRMMLWLKSAFRYILICSKSILIRLIIMMLVSLFLAERCPNWSRKMRFLARRIGISRS